MTDREPPDCDDHFASQLERIDQQLAGECAADEADTSSPDLEAAKRVLDLINRVRSAQPKGRPDTDRMTSEVGTNAGDDDAPGFPQQVGSYQITGRVARGGMGVVFRARDQSLNRIVALKMMLAGPFAHAEERSRFRIEAEAAAALDHPGIVPVYEVGEHDGQPYFTMGLVEGESLAQRIAKDPLNPQDAARIASQVASAVAYAHQQGVVHRDIKPANILLDASGRPRITDFGLARRTDTASDLTATEQVLGTPSYMAPEQASGTASGADERSDVYSMGATLYCMLTGRPPFQGHSAAETIRLVLEREPIAPKQLNPAIPIDLNTICIKCLQKDPDRRFRDALSLESDLQRFLDGVPIRARPIGFVETLWKWSRRHRAVAALTACCILAAITLIIGGVWYQNRLNRSLIELQDSRGQSVRSLYRAFTNEAEYLGQVRPIGYGQRIEQLIREALSLETDIKDPDQLRQLLVNGLGYAGARQPITLDSLGSKITAADLWSENEHLVVGLENGTLVVFDLKTQTKVFEDHSLSIPITRIDVNLTLEDGDARHLRAVGQGGAQISHWTYNGSSYDRDEELDPQIPPASFFSIEVSPNGRHRVGLQSPPPHLLNTRIWHTRSAYAPVTEPDRRIEGLDKIRFSIASMDPSRGFVIRQSDIPVSRRFDLNDEFLVVGRSWLDDKSIDDELSVYELRSDQLVRSINASVGALQNVRLSPDGRFVACGGTLGVEVFSLGSGERIARFTELGNCAVVSFVGNRGDVLVRSEDETLWLSARYGNPLIKLEHDSKDSSVRLTSDARRMVWIGDLRPRVVALYDDQHIRINAHNRIVQTVCLSPDGQLLLSTGPYYGGNETKVWNVTSGELEFEFIGSASTFSPDGTLLATWNGAMQLWDVRTGKRVAQSDCNETPSRIVFSESGTVLLAVGNFSGQSRAWRLQSAVPQTEGQASEANPRRDWNLRPLNIHADVRKPAAISPSGRQIAFAVNGSVVLDEVDHAGASRKLPINSTLGPDSLAFLDEHRLLVATGEAQVWDLKSGETSQLGPLELQPPVLVSPDKSKLLCGRQFVRMSDFQCIFKLPDWNNSITSASWSRDGRRVAYGLDGGDIAVWDLSSVRKTLAEIELPCHEIGTASWTPNDAASAMLRVGRQGANRIHPHQWRYDCRQLTQWIEADSIDHDRLRRRLYLLADQIVRLGSRPYFEPVPDPFGDILDATLQLNQNLVRIDQTDGQRVLLAAVSNGLRRQPPRSASRMMQASKIHHALGDLLNFRFQDNERAIASYHLEAELLEAVQTHPDNPRSEKELAGDWFWLHRNQALAFAREHQWQRAIDSMTKALQSQRRFSIPTVDEQILSQDHAALKQWQEQIR